MSKTSIIKHNNKIVNFTYDENDNFYKFCINDNPIKISHKRPRSPCLRNIFNSDTILRHKSVNEKHRWWNDGKHGEIISNFEEFCIYIKSKNKYFRCDINGKYDNSNNNNEYKTLSPFLIDNYLKYVPYYNRSQINSFDYMEYYCKKDTCFKSFKHIWHDTKIN